MPQRMCYSYNTARFYLFCLLLLTCYTSAQAVPPAQASEAAELEDILREQAARRVQASKPALAPLSAPAYRPAPARPQGKPPWVDGADPAYPMTSYLCAVGAAENRDAATNAAYGALARTFEVQVETSSHDALEHRQVTGNADRTVQNLQQRNQLRSQVTLQGVSIYETWKAPEGPVYAWACLDRARAAGALREQMATTDAKAASWLEQAATDDKTTRLRALTRALDAAAARHALAGQLHWLDASHAAKTTPQVDATEVATLLAQTLRDLRIGIFSEGADNAACRAALVQSIVARGYLATPVTERASLSDYDMVVVATTEMEHAGRTMVGDIPMELARGLLQVEIRRGGAVLAAYEATQKAGSQSVADARRRVLRGLAGQVAQDFGPKIDAAVRGAAAQVDL